MLDRTSKTHSLSLIRQHVVGKTKVGGGAYFHNTQHLCPNCCQSNAEQLFPCLPQIQPVDAVLLATVKSRSDDYHSVASTSPLLYLTHPSSQPLVRPITLTLPCPPNPDKKRDTRVQREETEQHHTRPVSTAAVWDQASSHRTR